MKNTEKYQVVRIFLKMPHEQAAIILNAKVVLGRTA
jgi:hypothetical protein